MNPDSTITAINATRSNPFRSRSTIITLACLGVLVAICLISMRSGFFTVEFAAMTLLVLRETIAAALGHQFRADAAANGNGKPNSTTPA